MVRRGPFRATLIEAGEIGAVRARSAVAPMEWRNDLQVIRLAPEGVVVAEGDTLVQLDAGFLEEALIEAQRDRENHLADLRRIEAEQSSRRLGLENAVRTARFQREQAELQQEKLGFESEARREDARLSLRKAEVALEKARAELRAQHTLDSLEVAQARLRIAEAENRIAAERRQIAAMTLTAPGPGLVVYAEIGDEPRRKIREGDTVPPAGTLVEIPDLSAMEAALSVHEVDWARLRPGLPAEIRLEAYPDRLFTGSIREIDRLALPAESDSQVRRFGVRVDIDGSDPVLKPGMSAQVSLILRAWEEALVVPRRALFVREGRAVVYPRSQWPEPREVRVGGRGPLEVVIEEGVTEGERLATTPPAPAPTEERTEEPS